MTEPLGAKFTVTLERRFALDEWAQAYTKHVDALPLLSGVAKYLWYELTGIAPTDAHHSGDYFDRIAEATFVFNNLQDATLFKLRWGGQ